MLRWYVYINGNRNRDEYDDGRITTIMVAVVVVLTIMVETVGATIIAETIVEAMKVATAAQTVAVMPGTDAGIAKISFAVTRSDVFQMSLTHCQLYLEIIDAYILHL